MILAGLKSDTKAPCSQTSKIFFRKHSKISLGLFPTLASPRKEILDFQNLWRALPSAYFPLNSDLHFQYARMNVHTCTHAQTHTAAILVVLVLIDLGPGTKGQPFVVHTEPRRRSCSLCIAPSQPWPPIQWQVFGQHKGSKLAHKVRLVHRGAMVIS